MPNSLHKGPPGGHRGFPAAAVENAACRAAMRYARVGASAVAAQTGGDPADPVTFAVLEAYAEFPGGAAATGVCPDDPLGLVRSFRSSALYAAWVEAGGPPALVFRGGDWGIGVLRPVRGLPDRACVLGFGGDGRAFAAEKFVAWLAATGWAGGGLGAGPRGAEGQDGEIDPY